MTESTKSGESKVTKAKDVFGLLQAVLTVAGAVGTLFVWLMANMYVGDVEVVPSKPVSTISVQVFDKKGQGTTYNTPHFQLMPGTYHMSVAVDGKAPAHFDTKVEFRRTSTVAVDVAQGPAIAEGAQSATPAEEESAKKRWWQFWRKKNQ